MAVSMMSPLTDEERTRLRAAVAAYRAGPDPVRIDEFTQLAADVGRWLHDVECTHPCDPEVYAVDRVGDVLDLLHAALRAEGSGTFHYLMDACRAAMSSRSLALHVVVVSNRAREYERLLTEIGEAAGCAEFYRIAEHIRAQKETT